MEHLIQWIGEHGKDTLESAGLIVSLGLATASFRAEARERRVSNLMALAEGHRELWLQITDRPELARILKRHLDLKKAPVSVVEERFVHLIITHLGVTYAAMQNRVLPNLVGLEEDVRNFFSLPIPAQVWKWSRRFQDPSFVHFVETAVITAAAS